MIDLNDYTIEKGDLKVISDEDNLIEANKRRLGCLFGETYIYDDYGSELDTLLGLRKNDVNLNLIEQEVLNTLLQDGRNQEIQVNAEYTKNGFKIDITVLYNDIEVEFTFDSEEDME